MLPPQQQRQATYTIEVLRLAVVGARDDYNAAALLQAMEGNAQLRLRGVIEETRRRGLELIPI